MEELIVNGKTLKYVGEPLSASMFDNGNWGGRSNFFTSNEKEKTRPDLNNLEDCFKWMKYWCTELGYIHGYVLDYSSKTVYYDKIEALNHLLYKKFSKLGREGYFENFIQRDFSK